MVGVPLYLLQMNRMVFPRMKGVKEHFWTVSYIHLKSASNFSYPLIHLKSPRLDPFPFFFHLTISISLALDALGTSTTTVLNST